MKGIILAGGNATRLQPATAVVSKQLLPVYDKPMIYYPVTTLIQASVTEILVIVKADDLELFRRLLQPLERLGLFFKFAIQRQPRGIAEAVLIADYHGFVGKQDTFYLILGDNIFASDFYHWGGNPYPATVYLASVADPSSYGVAEFDNQLGVITNIVEKPTVCPSRYAVTGLYVYDYSAVAKTRQLTPSARGELEITDLNLAYLREDRLAGAMLPEDAAWLDAGTARSLLQAAAYVEAKQERTGIPVGSPEVAAFMSGIASRHDALKGLPDSAYGSAVRRYFELGMPSER